MRRCGSAKPERSLDQAFSFLQKSANSGNATAQFYLGTMYQHGLATPINPQQAFRWLEKAAQNGNADAQNALGLYYAEGPRRCP
jgi:uncharacterized protein